MISVEKYTKIDPYELAYSCRIVNVSKDKVVGGVFFGSANWDISIHTEDDGATATPTLKTMSPSDQTTLRDAIRHFVLFFSDAGFTKIEATVHNVKSHEPTIKVEASRDPDQADMDYAVNQIMTLIDQQGVTDIPRNPNKWVWGGLEWFKHGRMNTRAPYKFCMNSFNA